jgi:hypothetical protein
MGYARLKQLVAILGAQRKPGTMAAKVRHAWQGLWRSENGQRYRVAAEIEGWRQLR